ncbi:MAG: MazG nucleotide pyrophosphohydrolase domain-containing protein [bacterium]|nr:MazG nucleotide pyrophosphohydrolase domain-containing protein [bacterium]
MLTYPTQATLPELQHYVQVKCRERGFDSASNLETFLLFSEEIGEMAKAIRNYQGLFQENASHSDTPENSQAQSELAEEMSDVLSYLLDLANRYHVNLDEAFRRKEAINDQRHWQ